MGEVQARLHEDAPTEELPDADAVTRLIIRVELPSDEAPKAQAVPRRTRPRPGLWAAGVIALLGLGWVGFRLLSPAPGKPTPAASVAVPPEAPASPGPAAPPASAAAAASAAAPASTPAPAPRAPSAAPAPPASVAAEVRPVHEVLPRVPRSALDTIRGTVRVAVRVNVDDQGAVTAATSEVPGPSRYFERLSLEASRQWRFAPAAGPQRPVRLRFHYTRSGVTAKAEPVPDGAGAQ